MKNFLLVAIAVFGFALTSSAQAENYKGFEWDLLKVGYAIPGGETATGGVVVGSEIRYNIKDNISASLRAEFALFGSSDDFFDENADLGAFGSYALIGDYYFATDKANRGFAGVGLGSFSGGSVTINGMEAEGFGGSEFGAVLRAGYEAGILRLTGEYNLIFAEGASNYIGIQVGISLFGGYTGG